MGGGVKSEGREFYRKDVFGVTVLGQNKKHIEKIERCLDFLNKKRFGAKIKQLNYIFILPGNGYFNVLNKASIKGVLCIIWLCQCLIIKETHLSYLSSLLLHEACHVTQWNRNGAEAEIDAYKIQREFLQKYGTPEEVQGLDQCLKEKWWVKMDKDFSGKHEALRYQELLTAGRLIIKNLF